MRLIDADALLRDARRLIDCIEKDGIELYVRINAVEVAAINAAPTIDAELERHCGRLTQKQRETLIGQAGMLCGLSYAVDRRVMDVIEKVVFELLKMAHDDEKNASEDERREKDA